MGKRKVRERNRETAGAGAGSKAGRHTETLRDTEKERGEWMLQDRNRFRREKGQRRVTGTERRGWRGERHMTPGDGNEWRHRPASHPPLLSARHSQGGRDPPSLWGTHQRNTGAKDSWPSWWTTQVLGDEMQHLRDGKGTLRSHPFHQQLHEEGTVHTPIPSRVPPHPASHRCLLASFSPGLLACRFLQVSVTISLSVSLSLYLYPPTSLSFHLPATLPVHAPAVHMSCCPPVSLLFCLFVPDQRLTQLLTLFVPAHAVFPG